MERSLSIACYLAGQDRWGKEIVTAINEINGCQVQWFFYFEQEEISNESRSKFSNKHLFKLLLLYHYLKFLYLVKQRKIDLLITFNPMRSFWFSAFSILLNINVKQIAYSFNFHDLSSSIKKQLQVWAFRKIDAFIVHSEYEKGLYSQHFNIPEEKFEVFLWSMDVPKFEPEQPIVTGDYICAIGTNARDYPTLMSAMANLAEIPAVIIVRPWNLENLNIPPNVKALVNLDEVQAMNILKYSCFMVLPLRNTNDCCGHVTLVAAMHLSKAFIATPSKGISDYVFDDFNAVTCEPASVKALINSVQMLWNNSDKCELLGRNGNWLAAKNCSGVSGRELLKSLIWKTLNRR